MASPKKATEPSPEVPIFLRKTYAMIDSCDPEIASWSDDGETFVVKDPVKFERTIIPQFFKHSKFSSFVRQLNFYSFRKIKYADTIRIDPELEKETANYWRFRHENFRKGRPELLTEIKRMNGQKGTTTNTKETTKGGGGGTTSSDTESKPNKEVQTLKKKIEEMTKNIDELTQMVQQVSLKQEEQGKIVDERLQIIPDFKRKRVEQSMKDELIPDITLSNLPAVAEETALQLEDNLAQTGEPLPDEMLSNLPMDLDDLDIPDSQLGPAELSPLASRETSDTTQVTDTEFVDQLFTAFNSTEGDEDASLAFDSSLMPSEPTVMPQLEVPQEDPNRPDPELMRRLGDALMLLPKETQELIINRLIEAITSTDGLDVTVRKVAEVASATTFEEKSEVAKVEQTPETVKKTTSHMPLAAATFTALLHHYSQQVQGKSPKNVSKSIPVIPVHA